MAATGYQHKPGGIVLEYIALQCNVLAGDGNGVLTAETGEAAVCYRALCTGDAE